MNVFELYKKAAASAINLNPINEMLLDVRQEVAVDEKGVPLLTKKRISKDRSDVPKQLPEPNSHWRGGSRGGSRFQRKSSRGASNAIRGARSTTQLNNSYAQAASTFNFANPERVKDWNV